MNLQQTLEHGRNAIRLPVSGEVVGVNGLTIWLEGVRSAIGDVLGEADAGELACVEALSRDAFKQLNDWKNQMRVRNEIVFFAIFFFFSFTNFLRCIIMVIIFYFVCNIILLLLL